MKTVANGAHTWQCPACGRRVPLRVSTCHCGMTRERAEAAAAAQAEASRPAARSPQPVRRGPRTPAAPLPRDVKVLLSGVALMAVFGLGWLAFGPAPDPVAPVLGYVDAGPPPAPRPTPSPTPPFKLPWWK
jgi:hypothetical protein